MTLAGLHPQSYPNWIYACERPERPYDKDTAYEFRCRACFIAAEAALASGVDPYLIAWDGLFAPPGARRFLSEWVRLAREALFSDDPLGARGWET